MLTVVSSVQMALQESHAALLSSLVSPLDSSIMILECRVEADGYAKIDRSLAAITDGRGLLEIVHQAAPSEPSGETEIPPDSTLPSMSQLSEHVDEKCVVSEQQVSTPKTEKYESEDEVEGMVKPKKVNLVIFDEPPVQYSLESEE